MKKILLAVVLVLAWCGSSKAQCYSQPVYYYSPPVYCQPVYYSCQPVYYPVYYSPPKTYNYTTSYRNTTPRPVVREERSYDADREEKPIRRPGPSTTYEPKE